MNAARPAPPASVSEPAAGFLAAIAATYGAEEVAFPALDDHDSWRQWVSVSETMTRPMFEVQVPAPERLARGSIVVDGLEIFTLTPTTLEDADAAPLFLDFHGGALVMCSGDLAWMMSAAAARGRDGITWVPDYRMPPSDPFPAALDDALTAYRAALTVRPAARIIVGGTSAGGNLAAAVLLHAKEEGLPMPGGLVLLSPEVDLTESGDSFATLRGIDISPTLMAVNELYANGADLAHPHLSPLFGDLTGFPPTHLAAGTRDFFLSNTVRMHRKLLASGVTAELHLFEAMPHGGFGGAAPEDQDLRESAHAFETRRLA